MDQHTKKQEEKHHYSQRQAQNKNGFAFRSDKHIPVAQVVVGSSPIIRPERASYTGGSFVLICGDVRSAQFLVEFCQHVREFMMSTRRLAVDVGRIGFRRC
jgi:hypothetical protein